MSALPLPHVLAALAATPAGERPPGPLIYRHRPAMSPDESQLRRLDLQSAQGVADPLPPHHSGCNQVCPGYPKALYTLSLDTNASSRIARAVNNVGNPMLARVASITGSQQLKPGAKQV